jgi:DNA-binding beta-propeller fold protein YncE
MKASLAVSSASFALSLLLFIAPGTSRAQNLFVANEGNNTIDKVNSSGSPTVFSGSTAGIKPEGIAFDNSGALFVANTWTDLGVFAIPALTLGMAWLAIELLALLRMGRPLHQVSVSKPLTARAKAPGGHGWWTGKYAMDALPQLRHANDKR